MITSRGLRAWLSRCVFHHEIKCWVYCCLRLYYDYQIKHMASMTYMTGFIVYAVLLIRNVVNETSGNFTEFGLHQKSPCS